MIGHSKPGEFGPNPRDELRVLFTALSEYSANSTLGQCRRFPMLFPSNECPYPGLCAEIVGLLARRMGMRVRPVVVGDNAAVSPYSPLHGGSSRRQQNDYGVNVTALLEDGRIDTACPFFQITNRRRELFDFSEELFKIGSSFVAHRRKHLGYEGMWSLFHPYADFTWAAILTTLVLQMAVALVIAKVERKWSSDKEKICSGWELVWRMVRLQLLQSQRLHFSSVAGKVITLTFCVLQCLLVVSLYQAWIIYSLVRQKHISPFTDLSGLLREMEAGRERFLELHNKKEMELRFWFFEVLKSSPNYPYAAFRPILTKYPAVEVQRKGQIIPYLERGGFVTVTQEDDPVYYIVAGHCHLLSSSMGMPLRGAHFLFRKGSPLKKRFDTAIVNERIFIRRIVRRYKNYLIAYRERMCENSEAAQRSYQPFGLVPLIGLGILTASFMMLATIVLLAECITSHFLAI